MFPDGSVPGADLRMRQNITELDSLLDDLHTAQKTNFADSKFALDHSYILLLLLSVHGSVINPGHGMNPGTLQIKQMQENNKC